VHDVLLGLHEAHEAKDDEGLPLGIVHRDVSPQNVIVGRDGLARLLDFGVAKARRSAHQSETGELKGKIPYMAPEQLFGEEIDRRVDVYAAGVLLWELLTGRRLYEAPTEGALIHRIFSGIVDPPSVEREGIPAELDALALRALSSAPGHRFPTALEMAEQLSRLVALPQRNEISAWVKRFVRQRELPEPITTPVRTTLERVMQQSSAERTRVEAMKTERVPKGRSFAVLLGPIVVAALVFSGAAFARWTDSTARAATSAAMAPTGTGRSDESLRVPRQALPIAPPDATPSSTSEIDNRGRAELTAPEPPTVSHGIRGMGAPRSGSHAPTPAKANAEAPTLLLQDATPKLVQDATLKLGPAVSPAAPASSAASCRPPFVVDAEGHRHYKSECL
jgi:serine/threonine-protein kinase